MLTFRIIVADFENVYFLNNKEFLETNYPRGRAIEVFRSFHFDLSGQKSKFCYFRLLTHFISLNRKS